MFLVANSCNNVQTHVYKRPPVFSRPLIFATAFMSFFSVVIALFKVKTFNFLWNTFVFTVKFFVLCVA